MLNFVICDDNLSIWVKFSNILESIFIEHLFDAKIVLMTSDIYELLHYVYENKTYVLILDINLKSDKTGLEIVSKVRVHHKSYIVNINNIVNFVQVSNLFYFDNGNTSDVDPKYKNVLFEEVKKHGYIK